MARLKAIVEIILLVGLGEYACDLTKCVRWVPDDIFFVDTDDSRQSSVNEARSAEEKELLISTVSTVLFILGILRTDLWSQGTKFVVCKKNSNMVSTKAK